MVSLQWCRAIHGLIWPQMTGHSVIYLRDGEGGEVAETRNAVVDAAIQADVETPISHLFWVDDDVIVMPGALLELLHQRTPICSGVYFTKRPGNLAEPLVYPLDGGVDQFRPNAIYEVASHGMGLTLVELSVYKRMAGKLPLDKYGRPAWYHTTTHDEEVRQDDNGVVDLGYTEDSYFLHNARAMGYKPRVACTKHAFGFHFTPERRDKAGKIVQMEQGYPTEQWSQWVAGEPIVWQTPEGPVVWD